MSARAKHCFFGVAETFSLQGMTLNFLLPYARLQITDSSFTKLKFAAGDQAEPIPATQIQSGRPLTDQNTSVIQTSLAPHDAEGLTSTTPALLKMYEKATETTRRRHASGDGKSVVKNETVSAMKNKKSQSLPSSPFSSPSSQRKRLGSLDTQVSNMGKMGHGRQDGSILSRVSGMFSQMPLQEKNEVDFEDQIDTANTVNTNTPNAAQSFIKWGTQTKMNVSDKDLNMFAPSMS